MSSSIQPTVEVFPGEYQGGLPADMLITLTNANQASRQSLINDDVFVFTFDLPWGEQGLVAGAVLHRVRSVCGMAALSRCQHSTFGTKLASATCYLLRFGSGLSALWWDPICR